jgi:hypothetical protein
MAMYTSIEYRIKSITRYIVTRHEGGENAGGVKQIGNEYNSYDTAYEVGYAVCRMEHERLGWPVGDGRIIYPEIRAETVNVSKA